MAKQTDAIDILEQITAAAQLARTVSRKLGSVRRADESTIATLDRLLEERKTVVTMLMKLDAHHSSYDFEFKNNYIDAIESVLKDEILAADAEERLKAKRKS